MLLIGADEKVWVNNVPTKEVCTKAVKKNNSKQQESLRTLLHKQDRTLSFYSFSGP